MDQTDEYGDPACNSCEFKVKAVEKAEVIKVEKILKGSLDLIPSPSPSVKIQIMGGNFTWGKTNIAG